MYNAMDIANWMITYASEHDMVNMSNLVLQKLLYLAQSFYLNKHKKPLFHDTIVAWDFGPVVEEVYMTYKRYGACMIPRAKDYMELDKETSKDIASVLEHFRDWSCTDLTKLVHNQDPWRDAYYNNTNVITNESILKYFCI